MSDNIALCCIGRLENQYAREFVQHYLNLGIDRIFIYDNNFGDEEHFENVLKDFIDQGYVEIINYRDKVKAQMMAYNDCYARHKNEYGWFVYCDFDEFYIFPKHGNIKDFLKEFPEDCQCVLTNWLCMTDNNLVYNDGRPLMERFTEFMPLDKCVQYQFPDNCHVKSIIKGGLDRINFCGNPHTTDTSLIAYHSNGKRCNNRPWQEIDYSNALIKHFTTKTIQEWMQNKMKKGTADRPYDVFIQFYKDRFFKINQMTQSKLDYLKSIEGIPEPSDGIS